MKRIILMMAVAAVTSGCAVAAKEIRSYPSLTVIRASAPPRSIAVQRIVTTIEQGAEVGTVQGGMACIGNNRWYWTKTGQLSDVAEQAYAGRLREELRRAGYKVIDTGPTTAGAALFEQGQDSGAELMIAAVIKAAAQNLCYPYAGLGNIRKTSGEASIEVEWQVYDRARKVVVLRRTLGGSAKQETGEHGLQEPLHDAFAAAARNLLADGEFSALASGR
jgi:serine protease Do